MCINDVETKRVDIHIDGIIAHVTFSYCILTTCTFSTALTNVSYAGT